MNICEFTSTRKRQSCIFKDPQGKIVLMCKGADSVITERLCASSRNSSVFHQTSSFVNAYAEEGLRTLFLAEKFLDEDEYNAWQNESNKAKLEINDREEKVAAVDEKIEVDLELIGSTAIEDRLQDNVPETIQFMKETGIKVWVLTGDKVETAINIGVSAGLLDAQMDQHVVEQEDISELDQVLRRIKDLIKKGKTIKK